VLILDDVSTDNSKLVIEKYRTNPKVAEIVYNETNSGSTFKQWQKGLGMAKGELIWIAESDDWCENNFLEVLVAGMLKQPGCVLAYTQSCIIDANNNIQRLTRGANLEEFMDGKAFIKQHLLKGTSIINASMAIFKKEAFINMPLDFIHFKFSGDWLFWIETAKQGNVFISGRVLNYFRKHDKDVSGKAYASGINFIENLKIILLLKTYGLISDTLYKQLVFIRYTVFKKNKKKYNQEAAKQIEKEFIGMFPSTFHARRYLFTMQLKSVFKTDGGK